MDWITIIVIVLFAMVAAVCVLLALLGLAGTWIMVAIALVIELLDFYWGDGETWGWMTLGVCFGLAVVGEIMEMGAGALGVKVGGGSRRGMVGAIIGGIVGGIALTPVIPIPVIWHPHRCSHRHFCWCCHWRSNAQRSLDRRRCSKISNWGDSWSHSRRHWQNRRRRGVLVHFGCYTLRLNEFTPDEFIYD